MFSYLLNNFKIMYLGEVDVAVVVEQVVVVVVIVAVVLLYPVPRHFFDVCFK